MISNRDRNWFRFSLRTLFVVVALAALLAFTLPRHAPDEAHDYYVGFTYAQIVERLGPPTHQWNGHFGLPPATWASQFAQPESLCFKRSKGTLYISVCSQNGKQVCFTSAWLPKGMAY